jgi:hypothetical protein
MITSNVVRTPRRVALPVAALAAWTLVSVALATAAPSGSPDPQWTVRPNYSIGYVSFQAQPPAVNGYLGPGRCARTTDGGRRCFYRGAALYVTFLPWQAGAGTALQALTITTVASSEAFPVLHKKKASSGRGRAVLGVVGSHPKDVQWAPATRSVPKG